MREIEGMKLTSEQLEIIRDSTTDEKAFQRVVTLFEDVHSTSTPQNRPDETFLFELDQEQIALLSALLNDIPVAIYVKDLNSRFIMVNQCTLNIMGLSAEDDIIGKTDFDLMSDEEAQFHFDLEQELWRTGQPLVDLELAIESERTNIKWVLTTKSPVRDTDGKIVGLIGVNRDITRQKLAEQSLEKQRNFLQTILDNIEDKIYLKDRHGRFILANATTLRENRVDSLEAFIGTTDFDYMPAERAQVLFDEEREIMTTGKAMINQELFTPAEVTRRDPMWFLVSKVPVYDENGNVYGLVGINRNITSQKLAEQKTMELKLERERGKILSDFITHTSHEFRTPISVIGTSTYLLKKLNEDDKQQEYTARIKQQIDRLSSLIDSLLLMVRLDRETSFQLYPLNLESFLTSIVNSIKPKTTDRNLTLQFSIDDPEISAFGNAEMLSTAVSAILNNAIHHTDDEGEIIIHSTAQDQHIVITIQDTGVGMSEETMRQIFNRFYRADESYSTRGFGLGLSIAKRIIELHGGRIEVESQVNIGSTFKIILPQMPTISE